VAKLTLRLEELTVESFAVDGPGGAGTVNAHETLESECQRGTGGGDGWSKESCTYCGCDTPGYTCEDRCFPATEQQAAR